MTREDVIGRDPDTFEEGILFLKSVQFPDTSSWSEDQFRRFNFCINFLIGNEKSGKDYKFSLKLVSVLYLKEQEIKCTYMKTGIVMGRYNKEYIEPVILQLIDRANKNREETPFLYLTHLLQFEYEDALHELSYTNIDPKKVCS